MKNGNKVILLILCLVASSLCYGSSTDKSKVFDIGLFFKFGERYDRTVGNFEDGIKLARKMFVKRHPNIKVNLHNTNHDNEFSSVIAGANKIIKSKVPVVIGGEDSHHAMLMAKSFEEKNIILMSPTATNPEVTKDKPFVFRACLSDANVAKSISNFIGKNLKLKKVGIIHGISMPYTDYLSKGIVKNLKDNYPNLKIIHEKFVRGKYGFESTIKKFKENDIDHVIAVTYERDILAFISQAKIMKFSPTYIGADGWGPAKNFQSRVVEKSNREFKAYQTAYWHDDASHLIAKQFKIQFKKEYKTEPNPWHAVGFDAAWLVLHAMNNTKNPRDGKQIQAALKKIKNIQLVTSKKFSFDADRSAIKSLPIFKLSQSKIEHYINVGSL